MEQPPKRTSLVHETAAILKEWIEGGILHDVLTGWLTSLVVLFPNEQFLLPVRVARMAFCAEISQRRTKLVKQARTWPVEMNLSFPMIAGGCPSKPSLQAGAASEAGNLN